MTMLFCCRCNWLQPSPPSCKALTCHTERKKTKRLGMRYSHYQCVRGTGGWGWSQFQRQPKKTICSFSLCCSMSRTKQMAAGGQRSNLFCIKLAQQRSRGQGWYTFIYINSLFLSCLFFNRKNAGKQFKVMAVQCR